VNVPFNILDVLDRAELVYGDRVGVVDEPDQPAGSWGELTWRAVAQRARALAAGLDRLGVGRGERVAIVSQNSARLLVALFGVSGWGRVAVPVNFRLNADEIGYIVRHSGAAVVLIDPEVDEALAGVSAPHRFVLGPESDDVLFPLDRTPAPWNEPSEDAVASINYTSGTTARPKGVELTHRNLYVNALTFGWHGLGPPAVEREDRRRLGEAVDLHELPTQLGLHPLDGDGGGGRRHGGRPDRPLPRAVGALQVPDQCRVPGRPGPHGHGQGPEVQAALAVLGRPRPPGVLAGHAVHAVGPTAPAGVRHTMYSGRTPP
jgi:acyl-CoA synthetase (AMP-forming)/AMP-acid ligase II